MFEAGGGGWAHYEKSGTFSSGTCNPQTGIRNHKQKPVTSVLEFKWQWNIYASCHLICPTLYISRSLRHQYFKVPTHSHNTVICHTPSVMYSLPHQFGKVRRLETYFKKVVHPDEVLAFYFHFDDATRCITLNVSFGKKIKEILVCKNNRCFGISVENMVRHE